MATLVFNLIVTLCASIVGLGAIVLSRLTAVASWSTSWLDALAFLLVLFAPLISLCYPVFAANHAFAKERRTAGRPTARAFLRGLLALLISLGGLIPFSFLGSVHEFSQQIENDAYSKLANRSKPLVDAIRSYERDKDAAPPSLEALVPTYLKVVPATGFGAYPQYDYKRREGTWFFGDNAWTLSVRSTGFYGVRFLPNGCRKEHHSAICFDGWFHTTL